MEATTIGSITQFAPLFLLTVIFSFIPYKLAPRVVANKFIWLILAVLPLINIFFLYYVAYRVAAHVLDRVNFLTSNYNSAMTPRAG